MDVKLVHAKIKEVVPESYLMFLSPSEGVSSSQANAMAEKTKELVRITSADILQSGAAKEVLHFNDRDVVLADPSIVDFKSNAQSTGCFYAVSACLREAVKAKEKALLFVHNISLDTLMARPKEVNVIEPEMDEVYKQTCTHEDAIAELGLVAYADYMALQSKCAEIGKLIHGNGALVQIKNDLFNFKTSRFHGLKDNNGLKDYPVTRAPIYKAEEINKQFLELMDLHREAEKKVNWYKAKIQNIMSDRDAQYERQYTLEYNAAKAKYDTEYQAYKQLRKVHQDAINLWTSQATELRYQVKTILSSYKIIIPIALGETYDYIEKF